MVIEVKITGGTMLVDDDVWFRFCMTIGNSIWIDKDGYGIFRSHGRTKFHRWVLGITNPLIEVGHANSIKLHNFKSNLYACSSSENKRNLNDYRLPSNTGVRGVQKVGQRYCATIRGDAGIQVVLGRFKTLEEAIAARKKAEEKYDYYATR